MFHFLCLCGNLEHFSLFFYKMYPYFIISAWQQFRQFNMCEGCALCLRSGASVSHPRGECWTGQSVPGQLPPGLQRRPGFHPEDHPTVPPARPVWILFPFCYLSHKSGKNVTLISKMGFFSFTELKYMFSHNANKCQLCFWHAKAHAAKISVGLCVCIWLRQTCWTKTNCRRSILDEKGGPREMDVGCKGWVRGWQFR